ncbi:hypothetical protein QKU48_gp1098 [Fadolivirus algeromassiliense]|jgi:hypothetical protein|uniref:Beta/gamma crystallin 'Greek key' domain-containing protein n=1 Tax=Fadolivirus FV1/VV64 TaxID=3070911 RepID=A0A7D3V7W1_9VIRU|nr:hypothetical protein QKU48_gp1098 [Fadolivirus algeromassiliense]QKF94556.1 hypothetical protein Fadolivirus_1_1098 [Fadolivirus FV1/VV64]
MGNVIAYEHCDYQGNLQNFPPGDYPWLGDQKIGNDSISSIKVLPNHKVIVYEHSNFEGESKEFGPGDYNCLVDIGWNDRISSLKVMATDTPTPPAPTPSPVPTPTPPQAVNCQMSDWIKGDCSGSKRKYTRTVIQQPQNNGQACPTDLDKLEDDSACTQNLPVDCKMSDWIKGSCFAGQRNSTRSIITEPQNGGQACGNTNKTEPDPTCNEPEPSNANNTSGGTNGTSNVISSGSTDYILYYVCGGICISCCCILMLLIIFFLMR